jgi:hypothetical protein
MRLFHCDRCGRTVPFSAQRCPACDALLGYVPERRAMRVLLPTADPSVFATDDLDPPLWRCLNSAWGCNWMLPAPSATAASDSTSAATSVTPWCRSCRLTRGRPDEADPDAVEAWMTAEAAKRRLVHQLDELALPIEIRSSTTPDGLAFDLVYLPGEGGITGHLDGVVTLDLAEADEGHRDDLRRRLGEPFRTVVGHLRHEIGHHYWGRLVGQADNLDRFRRLFGDEREDYRTAVERHYSAATGAWDRTRFVTAYAASHPLEDWAETFAHYLHILDATDTAVAHHLVPPGHAVVGSEGFAALSIEDILGAWRPINTAVNAIAETLGAPAVYPFDPVGAVVDKLAFVHRQVAAHTERDRFYATH